MQTQYEAHDPVALARQMGTLTTCYNTLLSIASAQQALLCLAGDEEQSLLASMNMLHRALAIQVAGLARKIRKDVADMERFAEGQEPVSAEVA